MRQRVIPALAALTKSRQDGDGFLETRARGVAVLNSALTGLMPPDVSTLVSQVKRTYIQYERRPDALSRNIYLTTLHDRNEVLFYRLFSESLAK